MNVYLLQHSHLIDDEDDTYDTKIIGIYSSEEIAMNVIKKYKKLLDLINIQKIFILTNIKWMKTIGQMAS